MPELPEVETVRQGLLPHLLQQKITDIIIRHPHLRFPIPTQLKAQVRGQKVLNISRRGKYLIFTLPKGNLIWHLGMSGSMRVLLKPLPARKHDHVDLIFSNQTCLRFNDPRRFGALLWTEQDPLLHPLLIKLGPEPLSKEFSTQYLWEKSRNKKVAIKTFLMNSQIVVGVGNIYAAEALFKARIHPATPAQKLSPAQCNHLCRAIKIILRQAIKRGGTTLKDFVKSDGKPGYFKQELQVYGRAGLACYVCNNKLKQLRQAQRATVYCPQCQ